MMDDYRSYSYADIGAYDVEMIKDNDEDNITWVPMWKQEFFWQSEKVEAFQIGDNEYYRGRTAKYSYNDYTYPAIYDTGTTLIYTPDGLGYELMMRLVKGLDYYYDRSSGFMIVDCSQKSYYEDVYFTIDGFKF
jgi:hypothetical protein